MNREPIYSALFAKVSIAPGMQTVSRRLRHWADVPPTDQPALFQIQKSETTTQLKGVPVKWTAKVDLYLYVNMSDPNNTPSTLLNYYLDAIESALAPDISGFQTLGGLVSHCWIGGSVETDEGVLGDQAVAIIPIEILAV